MSTTANRLVLAILLIATAFGMFILFCLPVYIKVGPGEPGDFLRTCFIFGGIALICAIGLGIFVRRVLTRTPLDAHGRWLLCAVSGIAITLNVMAAGLAFCGFIGIYRLVAHATSPLARSGLLKAIDRNDFDKVDRILMSNPGLAKGERDTAWPLVHALGKPAIFETLLQAGANVNERNRYETLLKYAVWGSPEEVLILLQHSARVNDTDKEDGATALMAAMDALNMQPGCKPEESIRILLEHGAGPSIKDNSGMDVLHERYSRRAPKEVRDQLQKALEARRNLEDAVRQSLFPGESPSTVSTQPTESNASDSSE